MPRHRVRVLKPSLVCALGLCLLAGCGQRGPLVLPGAASVAPAAPTPSPTAPPSSAASAATPAR
ncbi:LPS translocon maturation chaperone LptM [Ideonella sp.]|uniref:LPS translocon maturation chaperone LptM n=1 Tax=Ideonella sp. TaxID=1929293 RepID=UPI002B47BA87|nr:lipoprotein [Ideonella sp.]HJV68550.1 lipoprotein [Ideonella sp.]